MVKFNLNQQNIYRIIVVYLFLLFLLSTIVPFVLVLPIVMVALFFVHISGYKSNGLFLIICSSVFFSFLNFHRNIDSDLYNYYLFFEETRNRDFASFLSDTFISIRPSEIIFIFYTKLLSSMISFRLYVFITTFLIYSFSLFAIHRLMLLWFRIKLNVDLLHSYFLFYFLIVLNFSIFLSFTFSLTGHLVRQYLAMSIVFYAIVLHVDNKKSAIFFILISCLIHNSVLLISLLYFVSYYLSIRAKKIDAFLKYIIFFVFINLFVRYYLYNYFSLYLTMDNGIIPYYLILLDGSLLVIYFLSCYSLASELVGLYFFPLVYYIFLISFIDVDFIFLRYYFYMDFIRVVIIFYLVYRYVKISFVPLFSFISFLFVVLFYFRFESSGVVFVDSGRPINILLMSILDFL